MQNKIECRIEFLNQMSFFFNLSFQLNYGIRYLCECEFRRAAGKAGQ